MTSFIEDVPRWCIIQSDGDRAHLGTLTRVGASRVPIQYCRLGEPSQLAQRALQRALRVCVLQQVVVTTAESHRAWWSGPFWAVPARHRVVDESSGRQTVTLAMAVVAMEQEAPDAILTVMPADAFCANEWAVQSGITAAVRALENLPAHLLALATECARYDESQDYLVAGEPDDLPGRSVAHCIRRPTAPVGRNLIAKGAWVNSGIYVTRVSTMISILESLWPRMMESVRAIVQSPHEQGQELKVPARLAGAEFLRPWRHTWLQRPVARLRAIKLDDVAWSSLGSMETIERLASGYLAMPSNYSQGAPDLIARYLAMTQPRSASKHNHASPPQR